MSIKQRIAILCILFIISGCTVSDSSQSLVDSPVETLSASSTMNSIEPTPSPDYSILKSEIEVLIEQYLAENKQLKVGVVIEDLKTSQVIEINAQEEFDAASIGKLPILTLLYKKISEGQISSTEQIKIDESNVERYGTGTIQYQKLPMEYTVEELAKLMIKVSDNTASSVLAKRINREDLFRYVKDIGMTQTNTKNNTTVPYDTAIILKLIYNQYVAGDQYAVRMIEYLTDTAFETRLPKLIDPSVIIAHKIGTQTAQFHDAGIVLQESRPYLIVVYTKGLNDTELADTLIAEISLATYNHMSKL